jgi:hypothetical protein
MLPKAVWSARRAHNKKNPLVLFESPRNTERRFQIASEEIAKNQQWGTRRSRGSNPAPAIFYFCYKKFCKTKFGQGLIIAVKLSVRIDF